MIQVSSYQFNHPKNYIGYVLALKHGGSRDEADRLTVDNVTGAPDIARLGAQNMGLVEKERDGRQYNYSLTERGEWFCSNAPEYFGLRYPIEILEEFDKMRGARKRFVDEFPEFAEIAPDVVCGDPAVAFLVDALEDYHRECALTHSQYAVGTNKLFWELWNRNPQFGGKLMIRDDYVRDRVLGKDPGLWSPNTSNVDTDAIQSGQLPDGTSVYRSPTTYQLKNLLWHMGVLQSKGTQAKNLDPTEETWALEKDMLNRDPEFAHAINGGECHG